MKNKKECEIVQDLLVNYVDDVLNPESKKLVEEHLIECNECERKLKQINVHFNEQICYNAKCRKFYKKVMGV